MTNRRDLLGLYLTGGAAALVIAGCTPVQIADTEKKVADLINQVQAGVAAACAGAGKIIPTANSVMQVLLSIVGGNSVIGLAAAAISQAIADIVAVGCPPAPSAIMTNKGVPVTFY